MSQSAAIVAYLPYLRRFARVLTGSQRQGDAYVAATLEAILSGEVILGSSLDRRVALYHAFVKIWTSIPLNHERTEPVSEGRIGAADRNLGQMTPLPRVAFLLHALEGFTVDQIASTLGRPRQEIESLIDQAGREIAAQIKTDVLIIEDEPTIALDLETIVEELGLRVMGIAATRAKARSQVAAHHPGLVLADIRLADGSSGLDAVSDILKEISVPVVFITAYPEQLLTGERVEPAFLIAKPFDVGVVKATIGQALFFNPSPSRTVVSSSVERG